MLIKKENLIAEIFIIVFVGLLVVWMLSDVALGDDVNVSATIAGGIDCNYSTNTASFGELTTGLVTTAFGSTTIDITSNDVAVVKVQDTGSTTDPGLWYASEKDIIGSADSVGADTATLEAGTEGYGLQATTTDAGSGEVMTIAPRYDYASTTSNVGGFEISNINMASSTDAVAGRRIIIYLQAAISPSNLPGAYVDIITYTCSNTL